MSVQNARLIEHQSLAGRTRCRVLVGIAGMACLLASCGGTANVDIATVNLDLPDNEPAVEIVTGAADLPADDVDDSISVVGVAPVPPAPDASSSPAERQRLQSQALPGIDPETGAFERLPIPEEDLDDASNPANATPVPVAPPARTDLHLFPSTIPVEPDRATTAADGESASAGTAPADVVQNDSAYRVESNEFFPEGYYEDDFFAGGEEEPSVNPEPEVELDIETELEGDAIVDETLDSDSGREELVLSEGDATEEAVDCDARPWDRGCDVPDSVFEREVEAVSTPGGSEAAEVGDVQGGQGVDVSQEVIDLLLAPADNNIESATD